MLTFCAALATLAVQAAQAGEEKKSLEEFYKAVPEKSRKSIEAQFEEALKSTTQKTWLQDSERILNGTKFAAWEDLTPVVLNALQKETGLRAAALSLFLNGRYLAPGVRTVAKLKQLDPIAVAVTARLLEDKEKEARLQVLHFYEALAGGRMIPDEANRPRFVQTLDGESRTRVRQACEKASKDDDADVRDQAAKVLARLPK